MSASTIPAAATPAMPAPRPRWRRRLRRYGPAWTGGAIVIAWVLVAVLAPWISPYPPDAQDVVNRLQPPDAAHWLGTDVLGRDVFSRLLHGARLSLLAGFTVVLLGAAIAPRSASSPLGPAASGTRR